MHCNALTLLTAMRINAFNALTQRKRSFFTTHSRQIFSRPSWFISELNCEKIIKIGSELEKLFRICSCSFFMAHCVVKVRLYVQFATHLRKHQTWERNISQPLFSYSSWLGIEPGASEMVRQCLNPARPWRRPWRPRT